MKYFDWPITRRQVAAVVLTSAVATGCNSAPETPKEQPRGDMVESWSHSISDGVPHRGSILRDGTEIVTIGQHNHGAWFMLIRYRDESRFSVYDQNGRLKHKVLFAFSEQIMVKPLTPSEVVAAKQETLPDEVIREFNRCIAEAWNGGVAVVLQQRVALAIADALQISTEQVASRGYLDVEDIYRKAGWKVKYDKLGFNETYPAKFEFSK